MWKRLKQLFRRKPRRFQMEVGATIKVGGFKMRLSHINTGKRWFTFTPVDESVRIRKSPSNPIVSMSRPNLQLAGTIASMR